MNEPQRLAAVPLTGIVTPLALLHVLLYPLVAFFQALPDCVLPPLSVSDVAL